MNYLFCAKFMPDKALVSPQAVIKSYYSDGRAGRSELSCEKRERLKVPGT